MGTLQNILIIDDHPLIRDSMISSLNKHFPDYPLCSSTTAEQGLNIIKSSLEKNNNCSWLVLMDLNLPGVSGLSAIKKFLNLSKQIKIITISGNDDEIQVGACIGTGAIAFVSKTAPIENIIKLIGRALKGTIKKGEWLTNKGLIDSSKLREISLTERQTQVLSMVCQGLSNKKIAENLGITEITAKTHVGGIFRELNVVSRTQAVLVAQRLGLSSNSS